MKRTRSLAMLVAGMLAVCLVLAGCGAADHKAAFLGTWELCEMTEEGDVTNEDDLEMLKAFGLTVHLELSDDDTASMELFGEKMEGTWEATGKGEAKLSLDGYDATMVLEEEKLVMTQDGNQLKFRKYDPSADAEDDATDADAADADADDAADETDEAA